MRTVASMLLSAVGFVSLAATATAGSNDVIATVVNPTSGHVVLEVGGEAYFESVDVFTMADGHKYSTADGSLGYAGHSSTSGQDTFGTWNGTEISWKAGSTLFVTTVRQYGSGGGDSGDQAFVVFEQSWPQGAKNTSIPASANGVGAPRDGVLSSFPSFVVGTYPAVANAAQGPRGYLAFEGDMCASGTHVGQWDNSTGEVPGGVSGTGPLVVFDQDQARSAIISPFSQFFTASHEYDESSTGRILRAGTMGSVQELPAGYSTSTIVHGGSSFEPGVNAAVRGWGRTMRRAFDKPERVPDSDFTLRTLQYSTDNGAVYYYNTEVGKNYQETMVDIFKYAKQQGIPYRTWLVDSWWYPKDGKSAVTEWVPMPSIFPDGFEYIYNQTEWKSIAHNRFWSPENVYAKKNGGDYDFVFSGDFCLPVEADFWAHIMTDPRGPGSTMDVYEQDWLDFQTDKIPALTQNATLGRQWLLQMNEGAEVAGKHIQMCMSHVRHIMQSLEMPRVSQARASGDYHSSLTNQWIVGLSSMLANAVGIAPTKDNAWSETDQPLAKNKYHDDRTEPRHRLQSAVMSLSRGPVAFSDQIGLSNKTVIMRTCRSDGILMRPDRSATLVNKVINNRAFQGAPSQLPDGEVWSTESSIQDLAFGHVLSADLSDAMTLTPADLGLGNANYVAYEQNASHVLVQFDQSHPLQLSPSDQYNFELWHISPVAENGYALLGEVSKWVPTSGDRFLSYELDGDTATVTLEGEPGENVVVSIAKGNAVTEVACVIGQSGRNIVTMPAATCVETN